MLARKGSHLPELFHHLLTQLHILHYILNSHTTPCTACAHEFCGTTHPTKSNASLYLGLHLKRSKYLKQLSFISSSLVPPLPSYGSIHFVFYPSLHYFHLSILLLAKHIFTQVVPQASNMLCHKV